MWEVVKVSETSASYQAEGRRVEAVEVRDTEEEKYSRRGVGLTRREMRLGWQSREPGRRCEERAGSRRYGGNEGKERKRKRKERMEKKRDAKRNGEGRKRSKVKVIRLPTLERLKYMPVSC